MIVAVGMRDIHRYVMLNNYYELKEYTNLKQAILKTMYLLSPLSENNLFEIGSLGQKQKVNIDTIRCPLDI